MTDFAPELELVRLAVRNVEQLQQVFRAVESKLSKTQEGAQVLRGPCAVLDVKLLEAQARVEELIQKVHDSELVGAKARSDADFPTELSGR